MTNAIDKYIDIIEGVLLTAEQPLNIHILHKILNQYHIVNTLEVKQIVETIALNWQNKTLELIEIAGGWRFQSRSILKPYISFLYQEKPSKYSRATLEILSIIAYKQPVTRGDIEAIRGVSLNINSIKILEERGWIEVIGQREVVGRPNLYGTTINFLQDLGIYSLAQLPSLQELLINV